MMQRRYFMGAVAGAAAARIKATAASDTVNIAMIGVNGRGRALINSFLPLADVKITRICDVDEKAYAKAAAMVAEKQGAQPEHIPDLRRLLDNKGIDAVVIATPDHWHAPATIMACDAGKDVYVEKPASHNLREGRLMVDAARRNKRIVQHGTQGRSRQTTADAVDFVRSGKIGKVLAAKAWDIQMRDDIGHAPDSDPPSGVDYDTWIGPAPVLPFSKNRFHYTWHWNWNYGTGDIGNDGAHQMDMARMALGVDAPLRVSGFGGRLFFKDDQQTPDTMTIVYDYGEVAMTFEMRIWNPYGMSDQANGVEIYGSEGKVEIGRWPKIWGWKVFDSKGKMVSHLSEEGDGSHQRNFIDCVKSRKAPNAEIEIGHITSIHSHLGNIVAKTGRSLTFDPKTETITGDAEANKLLRREYRKHWSVPKNV